MTRHVLHDENRDLDLYETITFLIEMSHNLCEKVLMHLDELLMIFILGTKDGDR